MVVATFLFHASSCMAYKILDYQPVPLDQSKGKGTYEPASAAIGNDSIESTSPNVSFSKGPSTCHLLKQYLERLVHIYCNSDNELLPAKLRRLRKKYLKLTDQIQRTELGTEVSRYEEVCKCIHRHRNTGSSLNSILSRNLCGSTSTKRLRTVLVDNCRNCGPNYFRECPPHRERESPITQNRGASRLFLRANRNGGEQYGFRSRQD
jgi:hypothetical protein